MKTALFLVIFLVRSSFALIDEIPLPVDIQKCFDNAYEKGNLTRQIAEKLVWHCVHGSLWTRTGSAAQNKMPEVAMKWFAELIHQSIREAHSRRRMRRQTGRRRLVPRVRIRREYRLISDADRDRFHRAINMLKEDTSIPPNRFDALGRLHELLGVRAHDGPNFLGWHRFFLIVAENAMREKVPGVTIPYWDSTLDGYMSDPRASLMWTDSFMGNGNGLVRSGPFAGWTTSYGPLMRNFGDGGTMMNWTSIRDCYRRTHLAEITHPQADPEANIEDHHGEPHLWIGGHMSPQALAGYDPVFLLHHSFVDLVWELFRRIQRRRGVDPTTDYPLNNTGPPGHRFNDPSGFGSLLNRHALSDIFTTEMYTYQLPPTCSRQRPVCGSPYLRCDTSTGKAKCVAASVFDTPPGEVFDIEAIAAAAGQRRRRNAEGFTNNDKHVGNYLRYLDNAANIKCQPENIESNGLNYRGFFKDVVHTQKGLFVSSILTYIAIRTPTNISSEILLSAYDSCGRICRPFCRSDILRGYKPCQGSVRVTSSLPFEYGSDVMSISDNVWTYGANHIPTLNETIVFVKFFCDDGLYWPWSRK
ncbi:tyrosinase-like protein [Mya arenaria]|uniref:tyrosinase-like protein n=1 Tax=Mya arenaria TaxID=6604 RepID=UPI0022E27F55|nr:tyrosinase-like protein [Mya arenaria]